MILLLNVICACFACILCKEHLLRGVQPSNIALYDPDREFRCLDGSQTIPFAHINDDYCDCVDGSDEPGTSACPNGFFYCPNDGYKPSVIPSSRVNDAICDCCDGSDEYSGRTQCPSDCLRLGELLRLERERVEKMKLEGHRVYLEYVQRGQDAKISKQARLEELTKERDQVDMERAELEKRKTEVEQPENEAKERHQKAWDEVKDKKKAEDRVVAAKEAFRILDTNQDNLVSVAEIKTRLEFDIDADGEVSDEEAKEYLEDNEEVALDLFVEKIYENLPDIVQPPRDETKETESETKPATAETPDTEAQGDTERVQSDEGTETDTEEDEDEQDEGDDDKDDREDEDYDNYPEDDKPDENKKSDTEADDGDKMPAYDEETQRLIAVADEARRNYDAVDAKFRNIENEIRDVKRVLDQDLGPNVEYYQLVDQCFDFSDREYTYTLCPFDRAAQKSKHGASETSLGTWGVWSGPSEDKYSEMKYDRGQNCWNGPDRSATVTINCGITNELVSVSEPNRCEYRFVFNTPAACSQPPDPTHPSHSEL